MNKKLIVINLFSGPGAGKTSSCSQIFSYLKWNNVNCEQISEYAKKLTWRKNHKQLKNQLYVFSKQYNDIYMVEDEVDVVVTDSPLLLSVIYDAEKDEDLRRYIIKKHNKYENINIFIKRVKPYHKVGRSQTESESREIDSAVFSLLTELEESYEIINGTYEDMLKLSQDLVIKLKK
jgi:hypothetical protein